MRVLLCAQACIDVEAFVGLPAAKGLNLGTGGPGGEEGGGEPDPAGVPGVVPSNRLREVAEEETV